MARLVLTLLGGFEARLGGGPLLTLPTRKAQALLAYLALPPGRAHPRDKLAALLWGDLDNAAARNSLRQALFILRRALAPADPPCLVIEGDTLALVALTGAAMEVDVAAFEREVADGAPEALERAAALYQGDLLAGLPVAEVPFEEWLMAERERLRELALEALAKLLAHQRDAGAAEAAIQTAGRLLALDPLQEPVHRTLMRLYAQVGRRGGALRQYQVCVSVLQRDLGLEPEAETKQLYQELLQQRAPAHPASRPPRSTRRRAASRPVETPAHETVLIGRESEVAVLRRALETAVSGHGQVVAVLGEAGIGKSRLVGELFTEATRLTAEVLLGRSYESEQILPFGPWVDALRTALLGEPDLVTQLGAPWRAELARLFPELVESGLPPQPDAADQLRLFEAVAHLVNRLAAPHSLVLLLEDLHWADEMSCRLFSFLGRRIRRNPVLLVGTAREEELASATAFRHGLRELARDQHLVELRLSPFSQPDTARLVRVLARTGLDDLAASRLGEQVWKTSQGNPFVIVETMRALQEAAPFPTSGALPLPQPVRDMIAGRLERLTERAQQLASVAAVIGREFDFALLQHSAALGERQAAAGVEELVRRRVLQGVADRFNFTHDTIREVAYSQLVPVHRMLLHRHVAEAIEALYGADLRRHYPALGFHYREGGVWDRALTYFGQAGAEAAARSAHREGVTCFEEALKALERLPESRENFERAIDLRFELRNSLQPLGEFQRVFTHLREAEALTQALGDQRRIARALAFLANHFSLTGDHVQATRRPSVSQQSRLLWATCR